MKREKFRRLLSIVLMVVMVFTMNATAFAADMTYSITISNAHDGETYYIYKLFDATYDTNGNVAYTINSSSEWYSLVTATGSPFTVTTTTTTGVYNVTSSATADEITTWLAGLSATQLPTYDYNPTASGSTLEVTVSGAGYYYIKTTTGSLVTLGSATPSVVVRDKNSVPGVDKNVQEDSTGVYGDTNTADIGDTVYYTATISDAEDVEKLTYHDEMSTGLTFKGATSVSVTIVDSNDDLKATLTSGTDYNVVTGTSISDSCTFEVVFTAAGLAQVLDGYKIIIAYSATVNENAVIDGTGETNTGSLSYGNASTSEKSTTTTYVFDLDIYKYTKDSNGNEVALPGVEFVLYKIVGTTNSYAIVSGGKLTGWTSTESAATTLISDNNGSISVDGLDADTYYLKETKALDGYNKLTDVIRVEISESGKVTYTYGSDSGTGTIRVLNNAGSLLPSTGGIGTTIFYIVGGVLVLGAAVLFVTKKRLSSEN